MKKLPRGLIPTVVLCAGIVIGVGYRVARRHPGEESAFFSKPRVAADIITYRPLLEDMDVLQGEGNVDFTALDDKAWVILEKGAADARRGQ